MPKLAYHEFMQRTPTARTEVFRELVMDALKEVFEPESGKGIRWAVIYQDLPKTYKQETTLKQFQDAGRNAKRREGDNENYMAFLYWMYMDHPHTEQGVLRNNAANGVIRNFWRSSARPLFNLADAQETDETFGTLAAPVHIDDGSSYQESPDTSWGLFASEPNCISRHICTVGLTDFRQRPQFGSTVEAYLELFMEPFSIEGSGYKVGFRSVRIVVQADSRSDAILDYGSSYRGDGIVHQRAVAKLSGLRSFPHLDVTSIGGVLNAHFEWAQDCFLKIRPSGTSEPWTEVEIRASIDFSDLCLANAQEKGLTDQNKEAVITALSKRAIPNANADIGRMELANQIVTIRPAPAVDQEYERSN